MTSSLQPSCSNPSQACQHSITMSPCQHQNTLRLQLVDSLLGHLDAPVLDRLAKVLSFVRISGKNGKKLKRKDKLRMLEAMDQAQQGPPANGSAPHGVSEDTAQPPLPT